MARDRGEPGVGLHVVHTTADDCWSVIFVAHTRIPALHEAFKTKDEAIDCAEAWQGLIRFEAPMWMYIFVEGKMWSSSKPYKGKRQAVTSG